MAGPIDFDFNVHNVPISFKFKISVYLGPNKTSMFTSQCGGRERERERESLTLTFFFLFFFFF
jgi:hypothetical protein